MFTETIKFSDLPDGEDKPSGKPIDTGNGDGDGPPKPL